MFRESVLSLLILLLCAGCSNSGGSSGNSSVDDSQLDLSFAKTDLNDAVIGRQTFTTGDRTVQYTHGFLKRYSPGDTVAHSVRGAHGYALYLTTVPYNCDLVTGDISPGSYLITFVTYFDLIDNTLQPMSTFSYFYGYFDEGSNQANDYSTSDPVATLSAVYQDHATVSVSFNGYGGIIYDSPFEVILCD